MSARTAAGRADPPPPRPSRRRPPLAPPPLAAHQTRTTHVRPQAEKLSGMSLTEGGGGSHAWSQMNTRNKERMKKWKQSSDFTVNKGKKGVGVPMREVEPPGIPTMSDVVMTRVLYVE